MRFDLSLHCFGVKAWGTVNTVAIGDRHGADSLFRTGCGEFLGKAGTFEEAECRAGVKFNVHRYGHKAM
jgi:hypothetical protein